MFKFLDDKQTKKKQALLARRLGESPDDILTGWA
jgi:hypothetical protein